MLSWCSAERLPPAREMSGRTRETSPTVMFAGREVDRRSFRPVGGPLTPPKMRFSGPPGPPRAPGHPPRAPGPPRPPARARRGPPGGPGGGPDPPGTPKMSIFDPKMPVLGPPGGSRGALWGGKTANFGQKSGKIDEKCDFWGSPGPPGTVRGPPGGPPGGSPRGARRGPRGEILPPGAPPGSGPRKSQIPPHMRPGKGSKNAIFEGENFFPAPARKRKNRKKSAFSCTPQISVF